MMNLRILLDDADFNRKVRYKIEKYKVHDLILEENDEGQDVFLILKGEVQVSVHIEEDVRELTPGLAKLVENDVFGELSMFDGEPRSARVVALTDCEIVRFDGPDMLMFMDTYPEKGYFILREIFMRLIMHMRQSAIRTKTVLQLYLTEKRGGAG
jgi:CRP-like cAMP-binding protein